MSVEPKRKLPIKTPAKKNAASSQAEKSFVAHMRSAEKGDAEAQLSVALSYLSGEGIDRDEKEAFIWGKKAADQGYMEAQVFISYCFVDGIGIVSDEKQAGAWMRKAAEHGNPEAQFLLGLYYKESELPENKEAATVCFQLAAEKGHPEAQAELNNFSAKTPNLNVLVTVSEKTSAIFGQSAVKQKESENISGSTLSIEESFKQIHISNGT